MTAKEYDALPWFKKARIAMVVSDISVQDLTEKTGLTRNYVSAIVNGRVKSKPAIRLVSDILNITDQ